MPALTGRDVIRGIRRAIDLELLRSRRARNEQISQLIGEYYKANGIAVSGMRLEGQFLRAVRQEDIESIRPLSSKLLDQKPEQLRSGLLNLRIQIEELEALAHQVKTQASFVLALFRPFEPKYTDRWFAERNDIDANQVAKQIVALQEKTISNSESLIAWMEDVENLFRQLVEFDAEKLSTTFERPYGTVAPKSSRIYLAAWRELRQKAELVLMVARGQELDDADSLLSTSAERKSLKVSDDYIFYKEDRQRETRKSAISNERVTMGQTPPVMAQLSTSSARTSSPANSRRKLEVVVEIQSGIDASATAVKSWKGEKEFSTGLGSWVSSLPVLWGDLADKLIAKVTIQTSDNKSEISIPGLTPKTAVDRIASAAAVLVNQ